MTRKALKFPALQVKTEFSPALSTSAFSGQPWISLLAVLHVSHDFERQHIQHIRWEHVCFARADFQTTSREKFQGAPVLCIVCSWNNILSTNYADLWLWSGFACSRTLKQERDTDVKLNAAATEASRVVPESSFVTPPAKGGPNHLVFCKCKL